MHLIAINLWAFVACVVVRFVVGGLWFSPFAFSKAWQAETHVDDATMKARMPMALLLDLLGALLVTFVLDQAVHHAGLGGFKAGAALGVFAWLGFVAPVLWARSAYEGASVKLFLITGGYNLVSLVLMGGILGHWA